MTVHRCEFAAEGATIAAYRRATGITDPYPTQPAPLFPVIAAAAAMKAAVRELTGGDDEAQLLQVEHAMRFHRPVRTGECLRSTASITARRSTPSGTHASIGVEVVGDDGSQRASFDVVLLVLPGRLRAEIRPARASDPAGVDEDAWRSSFSISRDQVAAYGAASGDDNPIHHDAAVAARLGLSSVVAHGLCVLAGVVDRAVAPDAEVDGLVLRTVTARFVHPVFPDVPVDTTYRWSTTGGEIRFKSTSGGHTVLKSGRIGLGEGER